MSKLSLWFSVIAIGVSSASLWFNMQTYPEQKAPKILFCLAVVAFLAGIVYGIYKW